MRTYLLLILSVLFANFASAQYTLQINGNNINEGDIHTVQMTEGQTISALEFDLHSETSDDFILKRVSADMPDGATCGFCLDDHCYPPFTTISNPTSLNSNNEGKITIDYVPNGANTNATVCFKIYKASDENTSLSFYIKYSYPNAIKNINNDKTFTAYPNPANNKLNFSYETINSNSEIAIYNIVGEEVAHYQLSNGTKNLDVNISELPAGTYFYSLIKDSKRIETKRLVVKK